MTTKETTTTTAKKTVAGTKAGTKATSTAKATAPKTETPAIDKAELTSLAKELAKELLAEQKAEADKQIAELKKELKAVATEKAKNTRLDNEHLVQVRSITTARLIYKTREGIPYVWSGFGEIHELPMSELRYMRAAQPAFFTKGWVFIEDEQVVKELRLDNLYSALTGNLDFENLILNKNEKELKKVLENAPKGVGVSIGHFALKLMREKKLSDYNKIGLIEDYTGLDLKLFMD